MWNYLQEYWLPTLRNIVSQINETFGRNFQEMAVAGEVSLGLYVIIEIGFFNMLEWLHTHLFSGIVQMSMARTLINMEYL